jgi:hypothetical protein
VDIIVKLGVANIFKSADILQNILLIADSLTGCFAV